MCFEKIKNHCRRRLGRNPSSKFSFYISLAHDQQICYFVWIFASQKVMNCHIVAGELRVTTSNQQVQTVTSDREILTRTAVLAKTLSGDPNVDTAPLHVCAREMQTNRTFQHVKIFLWLTSSLTLLCAKIYSKLTTMSPCTWLGRWGDVLKICSWREVCFPLLFVRPGTLPGHILRAENFWQIEVN